MKRILIIEDDAAILKGLEIALKGEHYEILSADDGEKGFRLAAKENLDLILLDLMLPSKNGQEICRDLRAQGVTTPILMVTSKNEETDKILGFEIGADDYVTKPFSIRELLARIKALLRRHGEIKSNLAEYAFDHVLLDFKKQEASKNGNPISFSTKEFQILKFFAQHEGVVVTRNMLLDEVWGYENFPTTRTVDNFILSIRKKIEDNSSNPKHLITVHTSGYKFVR